jgi:hypothetical protein
LTLGHENSPKSAVPTRAHFAYCFKWTLKIPLQVTCEN